MTRRNRPDGRADTRELLALRRSHSAQIGTDACACWTKVRRGPATAGSVVCDDLLTPVHFRFPGWRSVAPPGHFVLGRITAAETGSSITR